VGVRRNDDIPRRRRLLPLYAKSLVVVALCTLFVVGYAATLVYVTGKAGNQSSRSTLGTQTSTCNTSDPGCVTFSITSSKLVSQNYTDELGPGNHQYLILGLEASGGGPVLTAALFLNGTSVGTVQGPFSPGVSRLINQTLPATVNIVLGKHYVVTVEGYYGNGSKTTWASVEVTAVKA
jgi:hypothetical protein